MNIRHKILIEASEPVTILQGESTFFDIEFMTNKDPYGVLGAFSLYLKLASGSVTATYETSGDERKSTDDMVPGDADILTAQADTLESATPFAPPLATRMRINLTETTGSASAEVEKLILVFQ